MLDSKEEYIIHQTNCISINLSASIFSKYPYANCYSCRRPMGKRNHAILDDIATPGTIDIKGDGLEERKVINLFGQYGMGKPNSYNQSKPDSSELRFTWFCEGMEAVRRLNPKSIAMPWKIGCGLGGGSWKEYYNFIKSWANSNSDIEVVLYKLEPTL